MKGVCKYAQSAGNSQGEQRLCVQATRQADDQDMQARSRQAQVSGVQAALQSEGMLETRLHLHDDGFLGDFSLLLSDYKENSRNS
jgi:hypothetical protein